MLVLQFHMAGSGVRGSVILFRLGKLLTHKATILSTQKRKWGTGTSKSAKNDCQPY